MIDWDSVLYRAWQVGLVLAVCVLLGVFVAMIDGPRP